MKIKTANLTDAALNWAISIARGSTEYIDLSKTYVGSDGTKYICTEGGFTINYLSWAQGGPIIDRENISIGRNLSNDEVSPGIFHLNLTDWKAESDYSVLLMRWSHTGHGPTPLIAAMRCYVASKLGDEVEIPEELCK